MKNARKERKDGANPSAGVPKAPLRQRCRRGVSGGKEGAVKIEDEKKRIAGLVQGINALRRKTDGIYVTLSTIRDRAVISGREDEREDAERILEYLNGAREELAGAEYALKSAVCVCKVVGEDDATLQRAFATV